MLGIPHISIHAPAKGATQENVIHQSNSMDFNPRSREGSDVNMENLYFGMTNFNPRSREGSDF